MNWLFTVLATITAYTLFSIFGLRTGGANSFQQAALTPVSNLIDFMLILFGSAGFGVATFYAFKSSTLAITIVISIGLLISFLFSAFFVNSEITTQRLVGLCTIIVGVWLIK